MTCAYGAFAEVYDKFMSGSPPRKWADYIEKIWDEYDAKPKLVVDLACGSGRVTRELAKRGRDMIGVDSSTEMLSEARRKKSPKDARILYLCQDMRELDLYGTSDSIVCLCDSINYIVDRGDLSRVFGLVRTFLNPGGIFVFDINSVYKYERVLKNNSFSGVYDDAAYIWENNYDKKTGLNEYYVTFFVKFGDKYERFDERHIQKAYEADEIAVLLAGAGFSDIRRYGAFKLTSPEKDDERIFFAAVK